MNLWRDPCPRDQIFLVKDRCSRTPTQIRPGNHQDNIHDNSASIVEIPPHKNHCVLDRKSTRLNSSHSQKSYAAFCLKKKKKHTLHLANTLFCILHRQHNWLLSEPVHPS